MSREYVLERTQVVPAPIEEAFAFFADALGLPGGQAPGLSPRGAPLRYRLTLGIFDHRAETVGELIKAEALASQPRRTT